MKKLWKLLKQLFSKVEKYIDQYINPSVEMVQNFKKFVDSPMADLITAIIPGQLDDVIKFKMRVALPVILADLNLITECKNAATDEEKIRCAQAAIAALPTTTMQQKALQDIASLMAAYLIPDGKLDWGEISSLTWASYKALIGQAA